MVLMLQRNPLILQIVVFDGRIAIVSAANTKLQDIQQCPFPISKSDRVPIQYPFTSRDDDHLSAMLIGLDVGDGARRLVYCCRKPWLRRAMMSDGRKQKLLCVYTLRELLRSSVSIGIGLADRGAD